MITLKPITYSEMKVNSYKKTKLELFVEEFESLGSEAAEIENWKDHYKSAGSVSSALYNAIRRMKKDSVYGVSQTKDKVYIYKKIMKEV